MSSFRTTIFALLLPAGILACGGTMFEMAVCTAEESHEAHATPVHSHADCGHDDSSDETFEQRGCDSVSCRYVAVPVHVAPARPDEHAGLRSIPLVLAGTAQCSDPYLPAVALPEALAPSLHPVGSWLRELVLSTVLRF